MPSHDRQTPPATPPLTGPVHRPRAIDTAFQLIIAGVVVGSVGKALAMMLDRDQLVALIRQALTGSGQPFTEDDVVGLIGPFRVIVALGVAILIGVLVLFAFRMRAGRNWARVLLTAYTMLSMVGFLNEVIATGAPLRLIWNLAGLAFS